LPEFTRSAVIDLFSLSDGAKRIPGQWPKRSRPKTPTPSFAARSSTAMQISSDSSRSFAHLERLS